VVAERTGTPQHSQVKLVWVSATSREAIITGFAQAAIAAFQNALTNREHNQGHEHPDTIAARGLAHAYSSAGRPAEAVALYEQMADSADRQLGPGHPVTLTTRAHLAEAYQAAARGKEALTAYQMLMTDSERLLGTRHPTTLGTRQRLARQRALPRPRSPDVQRPHARTSRPPPGPEGRSG
jgi:tetratricopeptide (TPR) repeat protein